MSQDINERLREIHRRKKEEAERQGGIKTSNITLLSEEVITPSSSSKSVLQLGKDFEKFKVDAVLDSNVKKIDKILSGVDEILAKIDSATKSEKVESVNPGKSVIYINVDEVFIKKGTSRNVSIDEVIELLKKTRSVTVVNTGGDNDDEGTSFSSDVDMYLDDISPNDSDEESS